MPWDDKNTLVNRLRLDELRLSKAQEAMAKSLKAFDEKKAELEHAVEIPMSQRESASKRQREAVKDYKKADQ